MGNKGFGIGLGAAVVALGLGAGTADAVPITGSLSFSDGGVTVPPVPSTSIVSQLNTITQGPPAANACSGSFTSAAPACDLSPPLTASTIDLLAPAGTIYTYGPFTFTLSGVSNIVRTPLAVGGAGLGNDALQFEIAGTVDDGPGGLDPTLWRAFGRATARAREQRLRLHARRT